MLSERDKWHAIGRDAVVGFRLAAAATQRRLTVILKRKLALFTGKMITSNTPVASL